MNEPELRVQGVAKALYTLPSSKSTSSSIFATSPAKAGSNLFFGVLKDLSLNSDMTYVDLPGVFWEHGISPKQVPPTVSELFRPRGYCYGGFRALPREYQVPEFANMRKILLVRDIRDMVVSNYFSLVYSHSLPGVTVGETWRTQISRFRAEIRAMKFEDAVLRLARDYIQPWRDYRKALARHAFRVWRYEDVIFRKREWIDELVGYLDISVPEASIANLVRMVDVVPKAENKEAFIRKVVPGDHKEKLGTKTIAKLDGMFSDYLDAFSYPRGRVGIFNRRRKPIPRNGDALGFDSM